MEEQNARTVDGIVVGLAQRSGSEPPYADGAAVQCRKAMVCGTGCLEEELARLMPRGDSGAAESQSWKSTSVQKGPTPCATSGVERRRPGVDVSVLGYVLVVLAWGLSALAWPQGWPGESGVLAPHRSRHGSEPSRMEGRHQRCPVSSDGSPPGDCMEIREL